jgi:hypothetical protein
MTGWNSSWPLDHGTEHDFLGEFIGFGFNHQHGVGGAGDDEVELGLFHLVDGRVDDVLAVNVADAGSTDGAEERGTGQTQGGGGANHCDHVRIVLEVVAEHGQR